MASPASGLIEASASNAPCAYAPFGIFSNRRSTAQELFSGERLARRLIFPTAVSAMDAKENALRIIHFENPEYVAGVLPVRFANYFGSNHEGFDGGEEPIAVGAEWTDIWGVGWRKELDGVMGFPRRHPLADLPRALREYAWPSPDDDRLCARIYERARSADLTGVFLGGSHRNALWERAYMLAGMENLMCCFKTEPNAVRELFRKIMDFQLGIQRHYLAIGVQIVMLSDDLGSQRSLLVSRECIEDFFLPEYRRLIEAYKREGVLIHFHSCGHIEPALDIFLDLGVDILNPVQASANNLDAVRLKTRGRMALSGGVDSALVMRGPVEAIRAETRRRLWQLGRQGGYFCRPDQGLPFPQAHLDALNETIEQFGRYPLAPPE